MAWKLDIRTINSERLRVTGAIYWFKKKPTKMQCVQRVFANAGHVEGGDERLAETAYTLSRDTHYDGTIDTLR